MSGLYGLIESIGASLLVPMPNISQQKREDEEMKKVFALVLFAVLAVNPAIAHQEGKHDGMEQGRMMNHGSGMGMMGGEHMHDRMQRMRQTMEQAQKTRDPEKRRELMRQHMETMHGTMQRMGPDRSDKSDTEAQGTAPSDMPMEKRMERMEQQMRMMREMMQQMMERESLEE